ncbi:MAG TPA: DEAD/DEAH box helicase [Bacteroidia bacterium]|nr:DEAD/DEAH box helicase [Bacteroidia bacterium]
MNSFEELGLDNRIIDAIKSMGFENPTPIQQQAIPQLLAEKRDLVGLAQTGTGKTAAFGLPLVHFTDFNKRYTQALIICPTRELCLQITRDLTNFSSNYENANVVAIYGGASIENQIREINRGAQIIVATPGRMVDMIDRGRIKLNAVKTVVLDEADEMLNMGFKEDLDNILSETPDEKNTWLFSATMPNEVARIAKNYMSNPIELTVGKQNQGAENIEHRYYMVHARDKYAALKRIADFNPDIFGIVFCRTRMETQEIAEHLIKDGYNADSLHGDLSQQQRDNVMKRYRNKTLQMLVATDVAARGIDVDNVTHVINYNLPDDPEVYTHRSGRTARAGRSGVSIAIVNMKEIGKIRDIERKIGKQFVKDKLPSGVQVCEKQLINLVNKIHDAEVNETEIEKFLPQVHEMLKDLSKEELIKRMLSEEFNRFLDYYRNAPDLNADDRNKERKTSATGYGNAEPTGRFFINLGEIDGMDQDSFRAYAAEVAGINPYDFKRINIKSTFSFFDVDPKLAMNVYNSFQFKKFNGRKIRIDHSDSKGSSSGGGGGQYPGKSDSGNRSGSIRRDRGSSADKKEGWGAKGKGSNDFYGGGKNQNRNSNFNEPKRENKRRRN